MNKSDPSDFISALFSGIIPKEEIDRIMNEAQSNLNSEDRFSKSKNQIMKYFKYSHLPEKLQAISKPIGELALFMDINIPDSAEKSVGLRKLLEAKDALVRANL